MNLPNKPGLLRRLAYGEYIRRLHFNTSTLPMTFRQGTLNVRGQGTLNVRGQGTLNAERVSGQGTLYMEPETYEELSELKNVEVGLSLEELLSNTKIEMQNLVFFCAICQDIQSETKIARVLICHHKFHIGCIEFWLSKNKTCPICRYDISYERGNKYD